MAFKRVVSDGPVATWPRDGTIPDIDPDAIASGVAVVDSPEKRLLLAVLENAIREARGVLTCSSATKQQHVDLKRDALLWLYSPGHPGRFGSAAFIFDALNIDHDWFLAQFTRHERARSRRTRA